MRERLKTAAMASTIAYVGFRMYQLVFTRGFVLGRDMGYNEGLEDMIAEFEELDKVNKIGFNTERGEDGE